MNKILTTRTALRHTIEAAKAVYYEQTAAMPPAPVVTSVSPSTGPWAGGTTVVITGTGFTGATTVRFGMANATSFVVNSDTQITAVAPFSPCGP